MNYKPNGSLISIKIEFLSSLNIVSTDNSHSKLRSRISTDSEFKITGLDLSG